jgi:hypothetical protein
MAQVFSRGDAIADELFQLFDFGKPACFPSGPDWLISDTNGEYTSAAGYQRNLADIGREGGQKFLSHPGCA